jgi:Uri superfamily endonuclease
VRARLSRHFREDKSKHWHIDYLREHVNPIAAWFSYELKRLEHLWAQALNDSREFSPIKGFGCSDCKCFSHLFHTSKAPDLDGFTNIIGKTLQAWKT